MITSNVVTRIFNLKYKNSMGTCFSIDIDNKQYFVTAKHVIENLKDGDSISISRDDNEWENFNVKLIGHSKYADVSVFALPILLNGFALPASSDGLIYGQDMYFLGFPFGLKANIGALNRGFPLPLVKKAILSSIFHVDNITFLLLDGFNNPGFSGGPVVFKKPNTKDFIVCGVVSSYRYELVETLQDGKPTNIKAISNTGIIIAHSIESALEIIKDNPNGVIIK